jgi:hypothetical protein
MTVLIIFSASSDGQVKFPSYVSAVGNFFDHFIVKDSIQPDLKFQKKPQGWFVEIRVDDSLIAVTRIWDSATGDFIEKSSTIDPGKQSKRSKYIGSWEKAHYDACPYFGYTGWGKDVINDFGNYEGKDTMKLYGIGRAYSAMADNLLSDRNRTGDSTSMFHFNSISEKLTPQQIARYLENRNKAISYYSQVEKLDPVFQTLVGDIGFKRANEYMTIYLDLLQYSTHEEALKVLPDNLYDNFISDFGYNILMNCPPDAILFVNGDMDTYVPMYLQEKIGLRRDVTVITQTQLALPRYMNYLQETGLKMKFKYEYVKENELEYLIFNKQREDLIWTFDDLLAYCKDKSNWNTYKGVGYTYLPTDQFKISGKSQLQWKYSSNYIFKSDYLMADIISTNFGKRPVCFATTCASEMHESFVDNMLKEGLIYVLSENRFNIKNSFIQVDVPKTYQLIFNTFNFSHINEAVRQQKLLNLNYRLSIQELAVVLANNDSKDSARKTLDFCMKHFSNETVPFNEFNYMIVEAYYRLGEIEEGNKIARTIYHNVKNNITPIESDVIYEKSDEDIDHKLENVRELMNKYGQGEEYLKFK